MLDKEKTADLADMIINGYAFTKIDAGVRVINLNKNDSAAVIDDSGAVIETSMDDIELDIVMDYYNRNKQYLEV